MNYCLCGHPKSHHFHPAKKRPSRITLKEDRHGQDLTPGKCLTFVGDCPCPRYQEAK